MHILDLGTPYKDNLEDFFLHNPQAHNGLTQAIIQQVCLERGIDWHDTDIMLALHVGTKILGELKRNNRISYTTKEMATIKKNELQLVECQKAVAE